MLTTTNLTVEAEIAAIKSAIGAIKTSVCRIRATEEGARKEGLPDHDIEEIRNLLDVVARRTKKVAEAEVALHEKISRVSPKDATGTPIVMIGT